MKLSIVIISFNTKDLTKQCLQSLCDLTDVTISKDFEVIIVDNNSHDDSVDMIKTSFPQVTLVESDENLGFSKGNNLGVKHTNPKTEYVLFLNSDTTVPNGTLSEMISFMDSDESIGLSTCKVMLWNGEIDMDCHRGFPTPWVSLTRLTGLHKLFPKSKIFNRYYQGWKDLETTHEIDSAVGAFMLVRRKVGEKIGWWDKDYFLNGEDIDFCYCVKQLGYKIMYHPAVTITHYRGASKGTRKESKEVTKASKKTKIVVVNATVDAMTLFYNKHYRGKYPKIIDMCVDCGVRLLRVKRLFHAR